jgi:hypothetical protein
MSASGQACFFAALSRPSKENSRGGERFRLGVFLLAFIALFSRLLYKDAYSDATSDATRGEYYKQGLSWTLASLTGRARICFDNALQTPDESAESKTGRVQNWGFPSYKLASRGMLLGMGNKDRRSREAKKPKKKTPKFAPPRRNSSQPTHVISTVTNPEKPPIGSQ